MNGEVALTKDEAWEFANRWVAAWNAHDLELIMEHYEDGVELTSPVAARLLGSADGKVIGKADLRAYFQRGLQAFFRTQVWPRRRAVGLEQHSAPVCKSKRHAYRGVHGAFAQRKGGEDSGKL